MECRGNERKIESEEKEKGGETTTCIAAIPSPQELLKIAQNLQKYIPLYYPLPPRLIISRIAGYSF